MGQKNNIIEINGKRYDARTGASLGHHSSVAPHKTHQAHRSIDGVSAVPAGKHQVVKSSRTPAHTKTQLPAPIHTKAHRSAAHDAAAHRPEPSHTLMRRAVKKPTPGLKRHTKAHGSTDTLLHRPQHLLDVKSSAHQLDPKRLRHARHVKKSHLISRFGEGQTILPVAVSTPMTTSLLPEEAPKALRPKPQPPVVAKRPKTTADLLEDALKHATSHEQPAPHVKKKRHFRPSKRITSVSALVAALAILVGFVGYQNLTTIQLKVASTKAGFSASLPGYQPAGYHLSHLNYDKGQVALQFQSGSDRDRSYAITEKPSAWDSAALHDVFIASLGQSYQTVETSGRTLYLYGQNAATWVTGGVWYQVKADSSFTDQQLVQLATSM